MDNIFRVVCLLLALCLFALAWRSFSDHRIALGLAQAAGCAGGISASNLLDPSRQFRLKAFLLGRERFQVTAIGAAMNFLSLFLLIAALCAGWFGL